MICLWLRQAGLGSLAHFSEDSGESSNQEDDYESEAGESEEHDDEYVYMDEQLERRSSGGQCPAADRRHGQCVVSVWSV